MKCLLKKDLTFKSGETWEQGSGVYASIEKNNPTVAILEKDGVKKRVHSVSLWRWFDEFEQFDEMDLQEAMMDGVCNSLTGCQVEPDGYDPEGFPSILLACGIG